MKCIVCGNENEFVALSPALCVTNNWLCKKCGLVFIPRGSQEKHDYYKEGGYYTDSTNLAARQFMISRHLLLQLAKDRVTTIEKLASIDLSNKSVLDAGCGYGETLGYLNLYRQCKVLGVEPSPETARSGEQMFGIKIAAALFEDYDFSGETFDLIMCNHTLEHVVDPSRFLEMLKFRLKPSGLLYLEVPNIMWPSGGFELNEFLCESHLQTFSAWNLSLLLSQAGYSIHSYSDENFLKFCCITRSSPENNSVASLPASNVEQFLQEYKANYSIVQRLRVYIGKISYLLRLLYSKIVDMAF